MPRVLSWLAIEIQHRYRLGLRRFTVAAGFSLRGTGDAAREFDYIPQAKACGYSDSIPK